MREHGNGVMAAVVTSLDDPEKIGRVQVRLPHLEDQTSPWARLVTPMAGPHRGAFFRPEVNDEVLVVFEHGDPRRAYVLGGVWSTVDPPPASDGKETENNWRSLVSRSGAVLRLDDTNGKEKVEIVDKDGTRRIVVDSGNARIEISCTDGDIEISAPSGRVTLSGRTVELRADQELNVRAGAELQLRGSVVHIN